MVAKVKTTKKSTRTTQTKTTTKATAKKAAPRRKTKLQVSQEEIARQAYMLWLERGGTEMDNWLEAEKQLR